MTERPQGWPGTPGREAEDVPADGEGRQSSPDPDRNLTPSGAGEDRGATDGGAVEQDLAVLLADAEAKRDEYLDIARRAQADFENYRKRMAAEVQAAALRGKAEAVRSFLPVVESFERALDHAGIDSVADLSGEDPIKQGWAMTYLDPNVHEALSTIQVEGAEAGVVVEVMQKGYRFDGHLIRPARVVVAA